MSYRIVVDSCCDLPKDKRSDSHFTIVSLMLDIDGHIIIDDETFDQADFLKRMKESPNCPKSSCPSPETYIEAFGEGDGDVYIVTLSATLSGSYNSAQLAKKIYLEEHKQRNIEVFNSCSASSGEVAIALKIEELVKQGHKFADIVSSINEFISGLQTKFVLETLDTLKKNGRLSNIQSLIVNVLNIKPIMGATPDGSIYKIEQARGTNKALIKMTDIVKSENIDFSNRLLIISHCNNLERAEFVKNEIKKRCSFKDILVVEQAGVSSLYANDGGIVLAY